MAKSTSSTSEETVTPYATEVQKAILEMKSNKAPGFEIYVRKTARPPLHKQLAKRYTCCLRTQEVPEAWRESEMILIH